MKELKKGLLPKKYFLDKHWFVLRDEIVNRIADERGIQETTELEEIVGDVLSLIKPTYKQAVKK